MGMLQTFKSQPQVPYDKRASGVYVCADHFTNATDVWRLIEGVALAVAGIRGRSGASGLDLRAGTPSRA